MSNTNTTKSCLVPKCLNNTTNAPDKLFFRVPYNAQFRKTWLKAIKTVDQLTAKSNLYCCEDHFDVENDVENYDKYKMVGGKIRLKKGVVPHKFECQQQKNDEPKESTESVVEKRKKKMLVKNTVPPTSKANDDEVFIAYCNEEYTIEDPLGLKNNGCMQKLKNDKKRDKAVQLQLKKKINELLHVMSNTSFSDETSTEILEAKPLKSEQTNAVKLNPGTHDEEQLYSDEHIYIETSRLSDHRLKPELPVLSEASAHEDEFDTFGRHVASQLRRMPLSEALKSQNHIQSYLSRKRLQILKENCSSPNVTNE